MKKTIMNKYDWRLKANYEFKISEIFIISKWFLKKLFSIFFNRFIIWFLMMKAEKSFIKRLKYWNICNVSIWSFMMKFWFVAIVHRRNCVESFFQMTLLNFSTWTNNENKHVCFLIIFLIIFRYNEQKK